MKNRRILSRALALALTLSMLPTPTLAVSLGDKLPGVNSSVYETLKAAVEDVAAHGGYPAAYIKDIQNGSAIVKEDDIKTQLILSALMADLPYHMYWSEKQLSAGYGFVNDILTEVNFVFTIAEDCMSGTEVSADAVADAKKAKAAADAIIDNAKTKGSAYNQLKYCFDEIKKLAEYNHAAADPNNKTPYGSPWQMTSIFDDKADTNPVCEGYAKAFKYLCDGLGIDCYLVSGTMSGGTGAGAHMWNIVRLDNKSYLVDVTNCDDTTIGTPDNLFLKAPDEKNGSSYTFSIPNQGSVIFTYNQNTLELFDSVNMSSVLELAETDYDPDSDTDDGSEDDNTGTGGDGSGDTTPDDDFNDELPITPAPDDGTTGGEESAPSVSYTITFDAGDGSGQMPPASAEYGYKLPECTFTAPAGYKFAGWYVQGAKFDDVIQPGIEITMSSDLTLTATWEKIPDVATYIVTFDSKGGTAVQSQTVEENGKVVKPADPTREGYRFEGWFCDGKPFSFDTAITADTVLTARWMQDGSLVNIYTVSFDTGVYGLNIAPQEVEGGSAAKKPADPVSSGYTFLHWLLDSVEYDFTAPVNQSITLTALWEKIQTVEPEKPDKPQKPTTPSKPSRPDRDDDDRDYVDMTGGGSGTTGGSSTTTEKNPDGSTTTTTKDNNGTVVENTKHPDGSSVQVKTDKNGTVTTTEKDANGNQTQTVEKADGSKEFTAKQKDGTKSTASVDEDGVVEAEVELSKKAVEAAAKNGEPIQLPIPEISSGKNSESSTVSVDLPDKAGSAKVVIPMDDMTPGTVVILVLPDGTEEVITQTKLTEDGLAVTLTGDATLKVVDNARDFDDVKDSDWFSDATDFVSSRNLFAGTSATEFSPNAPMTMEMLFAVAHNFMGKPETTASGVAGAKPEDWFHTASNWAAEMGLTAGLKMDMLGTNQPISREDTAILLFNLSGKAASYIPSAEALAKLNAFSDIADMNPANRTALAWAVENGIMNGMGDGSFGFKGNNTRAQTGAVMMNFNQKC